MIKWNAPAPLAGRVFIYYHMKKLFLYIILMFSTVAFAQKEVAAGMTLEKAFKKRSGKELKHFFEDWNKSIPTITPVELSKANDTVRQVYALFKAFYKPCVPNDNIGNVKLWDEAYQSVRYIVLQNSIRIRFIDKVHYSEQERDDYTVASVNRIIKTPETKKSYLRRKDGRLLEDTLEWFGPDGDANHSEVESRITFSDTIINFRPAIDCADKKIVYLTDDYAAMLDVFFGNEKASLGYEKVISTPSCSRELKKRISFFDKFIALKYYHWYNVRFSSYPVVKNILFDKDMKYAKIYFVLSGTGNEAIFKFENNEWVMLSSRRIWIA